MKDDLYQLDKRTLIDFFFDSIHLTLLHYALWFKETEHQLGLEKAIIADDAVWKQFLPNTMSRLAERLRLPVKDDAPEFLANLNEEELVQLLEDTAKNWLACDGLWFQAIEKYFDPEMHTSKRINDTIWLRFAYIEAKTIMKRLKLPESGDIPALKKALKYRQYTLINPCETVDLSENKILLRMNDCRVQSARKRKGLPDYNCKSGGMAEYSRFAEAIDSRIQTKCISCPPDPHPDEWCCAWEFEIPES